MSTRSLCWIAFALVACSSPAARPGGGPDETVRGAGCEPAQWKIRAELEAGVLADVLELGEWPSMTPREIQVLAWSAYADDRPVTIHNALVWVQGTEDDATETWLVLLLARNPGQPWGLASQPGSQRGQRFDAIPTGAEIDAFVDETPWRWELDGRWRFLAAGVCDQTWQDVSGDAPTHAFPAGTPDRL